MNSKRTNRGGSTFQRVIDSILLVALGATLTVGLADRNVAASTTDQAEKSAEEPDKETNSDDPSENEESASNEESSEKTETSPDEDASDDASTSEDKSEQNVEYYTVGPDETLGSIALNHVVSVEKLMEWNDLELGEAREGMRIVIGKPESEEDGQTDDESDESRPVVHRVKKGETLGDIAERYRVRTSQIKGWNPGLNPRRLQIGDRLKLRVPGRDGDPVSYGKPSSGRLYNGVPLRDGPGLRVRNVPEAYGTERTITLLKAATADVQARWPNSPDLVVGDLSLAGGGPMAPHRSHQSGRDVDLSFYYRGNVQLPNFEDMTARNFDARKNWHFFKLLIDSGHVEFIFVHMRLQKQLYEYARSIGYTKAQLREIMQYPRSEGARVGIIRHTGGHDNHSHVRFTCDPDSDHCR